MIDAGKIAAALRMSLGVAVEAAVCSPDANRSNWSAATWYDRPAEARIIRVDWPSPPTTQQDQAAAAAVAAYDPTPTEADRLDALPLPPRVLAALLIRASSGFSSLSAARRNRVMAIIDSAASDAAATLS